jgi:hypothetical protein
MLMTNTPGPAPAQAGGPPGTRDDPGGAGGEIDLRSPGRPWPAATWLLVTAADWPAGEAFTARPVPGPRPCAHGGDVLLHVVPSGGPQAGPVVRVTAWTVAAGSLVPVAEWDLPDDGGWPERVRVTVIFAMSAMCALEEHIDVGGLDPVDLDAAATAAAGLPPLGPSGVPVAG